MELKVSFFQLTFFVGGKSGAAVSAYEVGVEKYKKVIQWEQVLDAAILSH